MVRRRESAVSNHKAPVSISRPHPSGRRFAAPQDEGINRFRVVRRTRPTISAFFDPLFYSVNHSLTPFFLFTLPGTSSPQSAGITPPHLIGRALGRRTAHARLSHHRNRFTH